MSHLANPLLRGLLGRIFSNSTTGWLFGKARDGGNAAPEAVPAVSAQVKRVIPGVQEKLGVLVPGLKPTPEPNLANRKS